MFAIIMSIISGLLLVVALSWYIRDIWQGKVRLSIVTPFLLGMLGISQIASLIIAEAWYVVPFAGVAALLNIVASIIGYKRGRFELKKLDGLILLGGFAGIAIWLDTGNADYNVYATTVIMLIATIPAIRKTFKDPASETRMPWLFALASGICLALTVNSIDPVVWLVPLRQLIFAGLMNYAVRNEPLVRKQASV